MDNSVLYGLRNPAFTDDIGKTMIERQFPTTIDSLDGSGCYKTSKLNGGQPDNDTFQNSNGKHSTLKKIGIGLGIAGLGFAGWKFLPKLFKNGGIKSTFSPVTDFFKNIYHKIKK